MNEIPGIVTQGSASEARQIVAVLGDVGPGQVRKVNQAVEIMHGALEITLYRTHFSNAVTQVFGHHFVGFTYPKYKPVVVALYLLEHIEQLGWRTRWIDQHGRQVP